MPIADDVLNISPMDSATPITGRLIMVFLDPGEGPNPTPSPFAISQSVDDLVQFIKDNTTLTAAELDGLVEGFATVGTTTTIPAARFGNRTIGRDVLTFETISDADLTARLTDYALESDIRGYIKVPAREGSTEKWDASDVAIDTTGFTGDAANNDTVQKLAAAVSTLVASAGAVWVVPNSQQAFDAIRNRIRPGANITITPNDVDDTLTINAPASGGGSTTFTGLSDTPGSFSGQGGKVASVNSGETALEFTDAPTGARGPKGDKGDPGDPGAKGDKGDKGDPGNNAPSTLVGLTDTPSSYSGEGGKFIAVKSDITGVEFVDPPTGGTPDLTGSAAKNAIKDTVGEMVSGNTETDIAVTYESSDRTLDFVVTPTSDEKIQDVVGGMFSGNTELGIDARYVDSTGKINLRNVVQRGPAFPTSVYDGMPWSLTAPVMESGDRVIAPDEFSGDTIQKRFPLRTDAELAAESDTFEYIRAFSAEFAGSAPDNVLNNRGVLQVKGAPAVGARRVWLTIDDEAPRSFDVAATALAAFNTYYLLDSSFDFELVDGDKVLRWDVERTDGTFLYLDRLRPIDRYYYSTREHGFVDETVGGKASAVTVDATQWGDNLSTAISNAQEAFDALNSLVIRARVGSQEFSDQTGPGATVNSSNTGLRGTTIDSFRVGTGAASEFVLTGKAGMLIIDALITLSNESDPTQTGFGDSSDRSNSIRVYGFANIGDILAQPGYSVSADNGVRAITASRSLSCQGPA